MAGKNNEKLYVYCNRLLPDTLELDDLSKPENYLIPVVYVYNLETKKLDDSYRVGEADKDKDDFGEANVL